MLQANESSLVWCKVSVKAVIQYRLKPSEPWVILLLISQTFRALPYHRNSAFYPSFLFFVEFLYFCAFG